MYYLEKAFEAVDELGNRLRQIGFFPPINEGDNRYFLVAEYLEPIFGNRVPRQLIVGGSNPEEAADRFSRSPVCPERVVRLKVYDSRGAYVSSGKPLLSLG